MVYVDPLINYGWKLGPSCHMVADTEEELHAMAAKIGMKRSWFQPASKQQVPHYDLVASKRKLAVQNGAQQMTMREAGAYYSKHLKL